MRDNFESWMVNLAEWEGFKSDDPDDPGGETVYGIARTFHRDISWPPTWTQAKEIYLKEYWIAGGCDKLFFPLDVLHADSMVNPGPKGAREFLAESGEHKDPYIRCVEYATRRMRYYLARIKENPVRLKYLCGWIDRTLDFLERAVITKWSLSGS